MAVRFKIVAGGEIKQDISYFSLDKIRPATENGLLYDSFTPNVDEDDYRLYLSIREEGIREPLHVSADGFLLSGHRRYAAAHWLGFDTVSGVFQVCFRGVLFLPLSDYIRELFGRHFK